MHVFKKEKKKKKVDYKEERLAWLPFWLQAISYGAAKDTAQ